MDKKKKGIKRISAPVFGEDDEGNLYFDTETASDSDTGENLPESSKKVTSELEKDNESLNRELEASHKIIKSLRKRGKYKIGGLTDAEIEKIADQTRKQNGKINYTSMGKKLGVSRETVQREIKKRKLTYLIDSPSS
jgi:transcriptional regulator of acetoin/glycerol metabolism